MDQPKLERLLRLMKLLTANTTYNIDQLAERLQMSRRTVYRYIDTFRDAGFVIKKSGDCIRLDKESPHFRDISQLVHFTEEEAVILKSAIENIDDNNVLKQNLKRKLYSVYDNKTLADTVVRGKNAPNIRRLIEAIEEQRQAVLHGYQSPHGGEVRDRRVEPFAFTTNYVQVWCYDLESHSNKLFKTSRIGSVELSDAAWEHAAEHDEGFIDVFRMHGGTRRRVRLELGMLAYNLLCEEYPLAERDLKPLGRGGPLRRGAAGRHPHRRFARADEIHPGIPRGECAAGRRGGRIYFSHYFIAVSQPVTRAPFLCNVNQKQQDNGNSLQDQVQALRSAVRALHAAGFRTDADVRRLRRIRRNRNGHPVSGLPAAAQHHAGGVQRTGRGDLPLGLRPQKSRPGSAEITGNFHIFEK